VRIAVLGAAGKMGRWLVEYFMNQGHNLILSDIKKDEAAAFAKSLGINFAGNNLEAVKEAELIVVSVPIDKTLIVLSEVAPYLRKGTIVAEITSIKANITSFLAEISKYGVHPLSLHPLFGPKTQKLKKKVALIPVLDAEKEKKLAEKIFPDAQIISVNAEEHDRAMAITLSLPYFINAVFASILSNEDIAILNELSGTTFTLQLILTGSIMAQNSEIHTSLQTLNEYALEYLDKFITESEKTISLLREDPEAFRIFYEKLQKNLSKNLDLEDMYEKMYVFLETLER